MKKTGSATAAAAIAMHGFRMEVLARESGSCTKKNFNLGYTYTQTKHGILQRKLSRTLKWRRYLMRQLV